MSNNNRRGIRWAIFRYFGPPDLKNMVDYIDHQLEATGTEAIVVYPLGEFSFNVKTSQDDDIEPMVFPTPQERGAFQAGLSYGVQIMGGTTAALSQEDYDALTEMDKYSIKGNGSLN